MLLIDIAGKELAIEEQELLEHPLVSGLILFTRNFHDREQIQALVKSVRQRVKKPLLITVDFFDTPWTQTGSSRVRM